MALEETLEAIRDALVENNELLKIQNENSAAIMSKMGAGTTGKPASGKPAEKKPATKKPAAKKAGKMTLDKLKAAAGEYLGKSEDRDEKARLGTPLKAITEHYGVDRIGEIDEDHWVECHALLVKLAEAYDEGGVEGAEELDLELANEGDGGDTEGLI